MGRKPSNTRKSTIGNFEEPDIKSLIQATKNATTDPDSTTSGSGLENYDQSESVDTEDDIDVSDIQENINKKALSPELVEKLNAEQSANNITNQATLTPEQLDLINEKPDEVQHEIKQETVKKPEDAKQPGLSEAEMVVTIKELKHIIAQKDKELKRLSETDIQGILKKMSKLQDERDELLLKNSELEFEISRLKSEKTTDIKVSHNTSNLIPRYNTQTTKDQIPSINNKQSVINYRRMINNITTPKNGYEDWN